MLHCILVKWNDDGKKLPDAPAQIRALFRSALALDGVFAVEVLPNIVSNPNRYDLMIRMQISEEGLQRFDQSEIHQTWKDRYGAYIQHKAVIDVDA